MIAFLLYGLQPEEVKKPFISDSNHIYIQQPYTNVLNRLKAKFLRAQSTLKSAKVHFDSAKSYVSYASQRSCSFIQVKSMTCVPVLASVMGIAYYWYNHDKSDDSYPDFANSVLTHYSDAFSNTALVLLGSLLSKNNALPLLGFAFMHSARGQDSCLLTPLVDQIIDANTPYEAFLSIEKIFKNPPSILGIREKGGKVYHIGCI